jgi:hypothetical protein
MFYLILKYTLTYSENNDVQSLVPLLMFFSRIALCGAGPFLKPVTVPACFILELGSVTKQLASFGFVMSDCLISMRLAYITNTSSYTCICACR